MQKTGHTAVFLRHCGTRQFTAAAVYSDSEMMTPVTDLAWSRSLRSLCAQKYEDKGKGHPRTGHEVPEGEYRNSSTLSLTSALDAVIVQRHAPAALTAGKRPGTHCIGCWVGPRAGLEGCGKSRRHSTGIRSPDRPVRSESLYRLSYRSPRGKKYKQN